MNRVLIIDGGEPKQVAAGRAGGEFNEGLARVAEAVLSPHLEVCTTSVRAGYDPEEERQKFLRADLIIFQFPVFWFSVPGMLKSYIDNVYAHGVFFGAGDGEYGSGGMLTGKRYLLSTTWNAPSAAFSEGNRLFQGMGVDDVLKSVHLAQRYVGMTALPSFAALNVVREPNFDEWAGRWRDHLRRHVLQVGELSAAAC